MKKISLIIIATLLVSCEKKVDFASIEKINGYWQITKVVPIEGDKKEYKINENYEYFELKDKVGFHKKVRWQPMGSFLVDDLHEKVEASQKEDRVLLKFSSKFGKHAEFVKQISDSLLVLESEIGDEFYYKKVNINSLPHYGKKAE
jgi:hypothetical protein